MTLGARLRRLIGQAPWTLFIGAAVVALNAGLFRGAPSFSGGELIAALEFDRERIAAGELWRLLTGNLVHWSAAHLALDVGAFLVVGLLFERRPGRPYPWLLLAAAASVGGGLLLFAPHVEIYRGLSGVDSGQFAVAALGEILASRGQLARLVLPAAAAAVLLAKLTYECATGTMLFGTESLGDIGLPSPLAHVAGTIGASACYCLSSYSSSRRLASMRTR